LPQEVARSIERMGMVVHRYIRRTTTLLDIGRLTSGRFQLNLTTVNASATTAVVVADFASLAETAGSRLSVASQPGISGLFDRNAVEEVAVNLISKAIQHADNPVRGMQRPADGRRERLMTDAEYATLIQATATPIINTFGKMWMLLRFHAADALRERAVHEFDAWVSAFRYTSTELESQPCGARQPMTRLPLSFRLTLALRQQRSFRHSLWNDRNGRGTNPLRGNGDLPAVVSRRTVGQIRHGGRSTPAS
jgi:hypothetical protein